jgi:HSP20 family protein
MNIIPWKARENWLDPFESVEDIQNRLFNYPSVSPASKRLGQFSKIWVPAVDIYDTKDAIMFKADIPGLTKDQINVSVDNNILTIKGEKIDEREEKKKNIVRSERFYGSFQRTFTLPAGTDSAKCSRDNYT